MATLFALGAAQAAGNMSPVPVPMMDARRFVDSAERQTLPLYNISCTLWDDRAQKSSLILRQSGGRGVAGTKGELATLPAWRQFVRTPVRIDVVRDDSKIFSLASNVIKDSNVGLRWDSSDGQLASLRQGENGWVAFEILGEVGKEKSGKRQVAVVFKKSVPPEWKYTPSSVGFCSIDQQPQSPLSEVEMTEYRTQ